MRIYLIAVAGAALLALLAAVYMAGGANQRAKQERATSERKDRIDEAIIDGAGVDWRERVYNAQ